MITIQDCEKLYAKFKEYTETAGQHEFPMLLKVDLMIQASLEKWKEEVHQEEAEAMFRVVKKLFGITI